MLSQRAKYAIRAAQATELTERIKTPLHFVYGIVLELRQEGFLESKRG